jgi:hypothetical protein
MMKMRRKINMGWQFQREESTPFEAIPVGKHRIRVKSVEAKQSKNGNDMLEFKFEVSGHNSLLYHYITFLNDKPEINNRMLTQFFDAFAGIKEGDFKFAHWIGQVGACMVKADKDDAEKTKLSYFISADKQGDLPPWKEPAQSTQTPATGGASASIPAGFSEVEDDSDLPF